MKKIYFLLPIMLLAVSLSVRAQSFLFSYTGSMQTFTVPAGFTSIGFQAHGAEGGLNSTELSTLCSPTLPDSAGNGGCVEGTLAVTPGEVLNIYVGGQGTNGTVSGCTATAGVGGYNGGGNGAVGYGSYSGGGGGGQSDIRVGGIALSNAVVIAAGGGGAGGNYYNMLNYERGGDGGGLTGQDGKGDFMYFLMGGAQGGQPGSGGLPGSYPGWTTGMTGVQGAGGAAGSPSGGGGGGAGWWGGGGGCWGGGGGGSSYTDPILCTYVTQSQGCNNGGNGSVVICLTDPGVISGAAPLCTGKTLMLSETISGGIWTSSNPLIATVGSSSGIVTGVNGGLVAISYTIATPCATVYAVTTINVILSPLPIAGNDTICVGGLSALSDPSTGGYWTSSDTTLAQIGYSSGLVTGIYPGNPTITYTTVVGGCYTILPVHVIGIGGPHAVCDGSTVTLILPIGGGGAWSSSNPSVATVGSTGVVTGVSIGTSTISYSSTLCPESIVMTVNPIAPVLGADSVCVASGAYFTDIVGIGSWSSSNASVASVSAGPGLVTGISSGTAIISFTTPPGCVAEKPVSIIALPPAITGTLHVCPGTSTTLHETLGGGVWSSNNTTVATINSGGTATGINADTTSILYTILPGCVAEATLLVNPLPLAITGRDTICPGIIDTFHDASPGGLWASSTPVVDTIIDTNGILTSRLSGTGVINYTLPTGCVISKNVDVYPTPTPLITYNKFDNTLYTDTGYVHYQWYDSVSAGPIPFATSPSLAGVYGEWFYVVITDTNGCTSPSAKFNLSLSITGVKNVSDIAIKIYPNPLTSTLYIESPVNVRAVINGIDGKMEINQANAKEVDISNLAAGVYLISLYDDSGQVLTVQKIVKE